MADKPLKDMNIDDLEALWQRAKKAIARGEAETTHAASS
jgi:hypothetical protein